MFWRGRYITVSAGGRWAFHRCVVCGQRIGDRSSRLRGAGPGCRRLLTSELVEAAKASDRRRFVLETAGEPPPGL